MVLTFLIFFAVGKVFRAVVEKQNRNHTTNIKVANPRGGNLRLEFSDDMELTHVILTCIAS